MSKEKGKQMMEAHHTINGVATDILVNAEALISNEKDFEMFSKMLSKNCSIPIDEARELLRKHI